MLHAVVFPAHAGIDGQARANLVGVLNVSGTVVVAVVTLEARRADRSGQGASRGLDGVSSVLIAIAGVFALRVDGGFEQVCSAGAAVGGGQVTHRIVVVFAQLFHCVFIGTEGAVVTQLNDLATELDLVLVPGYREILVELDQVLRSAEGDRVARRLIQVAREDQRLRATRHGGHAARGVQGRADRSRSKGLQVVQAVVDDLRRADNARREDVRHGQGDVLAEGVLAGVVTRVRRVVDRTGGVNFVVTSVTSADVGLGREVEVNLANFVPGVLRRTTARINRNIVGDQIASQVIARVGEKSYRVDARVARLAAQLPDARSDVGTVGAHERLAARRDRAVGTRIQDVGLGAARTADANPFQVVEEEQLVLDDRAANAEAEVVAGVVAALNAVGVIVEGVGRQSRDAVELIGAAVQGVGAALGDQVDHATTGATILGAEVAGQNAEFLDGIKRNHLTDAGGVGIHVLGAIQQNAGGSRTRAVQRIAGAAGGVGVFRSVAGLSDQGVGVAVCIGGQILKVGGVNDRRDRRVLVVDADGLRIGGDFHNRRAAEDAQNSRDVVVGGDVHLEPALELLETGGLDGDLVGGGLQGWEGIDAGGICRAGARHVGINGRHCDLGIRDHGARLVFHGACDLTGFGLAEGRNRQTEQQQREDQHSRQFLHLSSLWNVIKQLQVNVLSTAQTRGIPSGAPRADCCTCLYIEHVSDQTPV